MLPSALLKKLSAGRQAEKVGNTTTNGKQQHALKPHNKRKLVTSAAATSSPSSEASTTAKQPSAKKSKAKYEATAALHKKPLTTDEINRLQESAGSLTNENLFVLQIDEIVRATETPTKYAVFVEEWLADLNAFIGTLPSDATKVASAKLKKSPAGNRIPMDENGVRVPPFQFQFVAPKAPAYLIGSLATATVVGPTVHADVSVEMPAQCFQKNDYLSLVYHKKRALYVQRLATALRDWPKAGEVRYTFFRGDRLRPVLQLRPGKLTSGTVSV